MFISAFQRFNLGIHLHIKDATVQHNNNSLQTSHKGLFVYIFMHLADAFIQSDLHCIQVTVSTFYQLIFVMIGQYLSENLESERAKKSQY